MTDPKTGVSSAIVGEFDLIDGMPKDVKNTWAFEYNQTKNTICLQVVVGIPPMLIDNSNQSLTTAIEISDVDQLIIFLATVKMNSNKSSSSSN